MVVYLRLFPRVITAAPTTMLTAIIAPITSYTNREGGGETDDGGVGVGTIPSLFLSIEVLRTSCVAYLYP